MGNEEALEPLLDPKRYLLLRSSATSALKPAADARNDRAIQALIAAATDPEQQGLWLLATERLTDPQTLLYFLFAPGEETVPSNSTMKFTPSGVVSVKSASPVALANRPVPPVKV